MQKWEYLVFSWTMTDGTLREHYERLRVAGERGWELVGIARKPWAVTEAGENYYYFKRPLDDSDEDDDDDDEDLF